MRNNAASHTKTQEIIVHVLNFHHIISSHIEIVLECEDNYGFNSYLYMNRWYNLLTGWSSKNNLMYWVCDHQIKEAHSKFKFKINKNPLEIQKAWASYSHDNPAFILTTNCARAAQWFLTTYADIPEPNLSNISLNYTTFLLPPLPSFFLPYSSLLPGRVMDNAKFHAEIRNNPKKFADYSYTFLYTKLSLAFLIAAVSILTIITAFTIMTPSMAILSLAGAGLAFSGSSYVFFQNYNLLSAKNIVEDKNVTDENNINESDITAHNEILVSPKL